MSKSCPTCGRSDSARSKVSHDHYHAAVARAHDNLPEHLAEDFADADALRKWCLIRAGFRDERQFVAGSREEALRLAAYIKPMDAYAVVIVRGNTVTHCTARSQSMRAMGKSEFTRSKEAVLALLAKLIGTDVAELKSARAA